MPRSHHLVPGHCSSRPQFAPGPEARTSSTSQINESAAVTPRARTSLSGAKVSINTRQPSGIKDQPLNFGGSTRRPYQWRSAASCLCRRRSWVRPRARCFFPSIRSSTYDHKLTVLAFFGGYRWSILIANVDGAISFLAQCDACYGGLVHKKRFKTE